MELDPTQSLQEGLMQLMGPVIKTIDGQVDATLKSQEALRQQIEILHKGLNDTPQELEVYIQKLARSRQQINNINSLLSNVQDRVNRLHQNIIRSSKQAVSPAK